MDDSRLFGMLVFFCTVTGVSSQNPITVSDVYKELEELRKNIRKLAYQVMMQQNYIEEKIRTEGYSGIKSVRGGWRGFNNYDTVTHLQPKAFDIHDHSNYDRTIGLGEVVAVLNGVEFRTRHNDYKLVMPSTTYKEYDAVEDIPFPEVPPQVLDKPTLEEQIQELREWFKAFKKQDNSVRDYPQYFKPVMCYLEGTWTRDKEIREPFSSDRHKLDASSWSQLHRKTRAAAFSGIRHLEGNLAFLPTTIMDIKNITDIPEYAQWNYRILCAPINFDIPFSSFFQADDLTYRVSTGMGIPEVTNSPAARFKLYDSSRMWNFGIMDAIFAEIPGKNNHGGNMSLTVFGEDIFSTQNMDRSERLNAAYYFRSYKMLGQGAMGTSFAPLGFNDENLWMALTSQAVVAPMEYEQCYSIRVRPRKFKVQCLNEDIRLSYALPLEIIYLTPLLSWNPLGLKFNTNKKVTVQDGRDGSSAAKALKGVDSSHFYMTPVEFFTGPNSTTDPDRKFMYVSNPEGQAKKVVSSGTRVFLPDILGLGKIRLRFPIAPVHGEGTSLWKELNALKDVSLGTGRGPPTTVMFQMALTTIQPLGEHTHDLWINYDEFLILLAGGTTSVVTRQAQGHTHNLILSYSKDTKFRYDLCDGYELCPDRHARTITLETQNSYTELPP